MRFAFKILILLNFPSMSYAQVSMNNCDSAKLQLTIGGGINHQFPFGEKYIEPGDPSSTSHSVELDGFTENRRISYHGYILVKYHFHSCKLPAFRNYYLGTGLSFFNRNTIYYSDSASVSMYQLPYMPNRNIIEYTESLNTIETPIFVGWKRENISIESGIFITLPIKAFFKAKTTHIDYSEIYYSGSSASHYIHSYRSSISGNIKIQYNFKRTIFKPSIYLALKIRNIYNQQELFGGIEIPLSN